MKERVHAAALAAAVSPTARVLPTTKLAPLPPFLAIGRDDRDESDHGNRDDDPVAAAIAAAAARSPPTKYPRLQTLASLAHDHVTAMHHGDFVARSRDRWQRQQLQHPHDHDHMPIERDGARALRLSRESAALVLQSAWRRSAAVRLRERLVRGMWQELMTLAAWLTHDRTQLQQVLETLLMADSRRPLVETARRLHLLTASSSSVFDGHASRLSTLHGAFVRLPALLLATWLCFTLGIRRRCRFLRIPAPAILHAVHIPVRKTCRLYARLWRESSRLAARTIQCCARTFLARCTYWNLLTVHRRTQAAVRLQTVYRAWVARRVVWRLRRRRAAIRIQCAWRVWNARRRVRHQRVSLLATHFLSGVTIHALERASAQIVERAACHIQRTFRGQRARAQFRVLVARRFQQHWHRNPSRGYRLFDQQCYVQAAVYLERCFRQGIFQDNAAATTITIATNERRPVSRGRGGVNFQRHRLLPTGSRLTYSFSEAPTPLDPDLVAHGGPRRLHDDRRPATPSHDPLLPAARTSLATKELQFWQTYALAHWFSFQSNGDPLHLRQARVGFETFLRLDAVSSRDSVSSTANEPELQLVRLHTRVCLVYCVYWSKTLRQQQHGRRGDEHELTLSLCIETLDEVEMWSSQTTSDLVHQANAWRAQLLVTSASLYRDDGELDACCAQLQTLLAMTLRGECDLFQACDLHFLLAVVLLQCPKGQETLDRTRQAEVHLTLCYQAVELWAAVGFYHGEVSSVVAAARLQDEPVGSFLLHHEPLDTSQIDPHTGASSATATSARKLLLKVKRSDDPCKVSSLRIHLEDGVYHMKKLPNCSHASVHELIQQLPPAAGVQWARGVRRALYVPALETKLSADHQTKSARRACLLPWEQWTWRVSTASMRHNDCWGALCQVFAIRLEASEAHAMAAVVAHDGLLVARDRALRADLFFTVGRVCSHLQRRVDATLAIKHAAIESARLSTPFDRNFAAVAHAMARVGTQRHAFANQLERVAKLERMCVKAWSLDSCSPTLRGYPFCEALLLQRVDNEVAHDSVADTFFVRALLRAHVKAFVSTGVCEATHMEHAFACVRRLYERFHQVTTSQVDDADGVLACARRLRKTLRRDPKSLEAAHSSAFSFHALLIIWHRIPFQVAFEMAEVFYRWPLMGSDTLLDVYESLYGRLRSVKPRNWAYAAYEEVVLVRVAFLYAQRVNDTADGSTQATLARKAVEVLDELIGLRRLRALGSHIAVSVKRIQWPTPVSFPLQFSLAELLFMRGFLWERASKVDTSSKVSQTTAHANAWRDYDSLHSELLTMVVNEQEREREATRRQKKLKGVRVFVGDTIDVGVTDVLYSKPFVVAQCDKQQLSTQQPATWMHQLSPGWNEYVEVDVASSKARLVISVMNRSTRLRRRYADDQVLGYVHVFVEEILSNSAARQRPQWYDLIRRDAVDATVMTGKRPRIRLGFQLTMQAVEIDETASTRRPARVLRGNWDVSQLKLHLHGDLRRFVGSPWVWRWYGRKWLHDKEFYIAAYFLQRAIELHNVAISTQSPEEESLAHAVDLVDLAKCYRATMGPTWLDYARPMLEQASTIIADAYARSGSSDLSLWKHLVTISTLMATEHEPSGPLTKELSKQIPASSHWIAMRRRRRNGDADGDAEANSDGEVYYFNEDTCERFGGVANEPHMRAPLEWEPDSERTVVAMTSRDPLLPRRVVVMTTEMKARVAFHCESQRERHGHYPCQWVAVFNPRKQVMQFVSLAAEPDDDQRDPSAVRMTTTQPPMYAMVVDAFFMYHVLVIQDAFRKYQQRRQRQRRVRGLLRSSFAFACERRAAQTRLAARAEAERKRKLNCLHVVVERATKLRAMDLFTSDPFVVLELVDADGDVVAKGETSVRRNTVNPQWHEEFHLQYAFVDHAQPPTHTQQQQPPRLRLRVFDRDMVRGLRQRDDDEAKEAVDQEDPDDDNDDGNRPDDAARETQRKHDFLGLAETPIDLLAHGKCVTAELVLRDDDEGDNVDANAVAARGTLTLTVQWVYDRDHLTPTTFTQLRRHAVKPMLLVRPRKRTRPKPMVTDACRDLLATARHARVAVLTGMADMGVLLDQLVRLFKRWRVAQVSGRTADEAKLMEQRLRAATTAPQPFYGQYAALATAVATAIAATTALLRVVETPIRDWVESCDRQTATTLNATLTAAVRGIEEAGAVLLTWDSDVHAFVGLMGRVLTLRHSVVTWRREVCTLLETFYEPPVPAWDEPDEMAATLDHFARIDTLLQNAIDDTPSRPPSAKGPAKNSPGNSSNTSDMASSGQRPIGNAVVAPVATPPTTNAAVAKRMERIERERRKAQKQKK